MATKKITLNELRSLVKKIIKEEIEYNQSSTLIPIYKLDRYNDNDGAYEIIFYFDNNKDEIIGKKLDGYTSKQASEINDKFLKQNEDKIKSILVSQIIKEHPSISSGYKLGSGDYNVQVNVKNSKKYKGNTAELLKIFEQYSNYSRQKVSVAKIKGEDGEIYYISPNTITIPTDSIETMLMGLPINRLFGFDSNNRDNKYYFI